MDAMINFFLDTILVLVNIFVSASCLIYLYRTYKLVRNGDYRKRILRMWMVVSAVWFILFTFMLINRTDVHIFGRLMARPAVTLSMGILLSDIIARFRRYQAYIDRSEGEQHDS